MLVCVILAGDPRGWRVCSSFRAFELSSFRAFEFGCCAGVCCVVVSRVCSGLARARERERLVMGAREFGWFPTVGESYRVSWRANPSITAIVRVTRVRRGRVRVVGQTGQVFRLSFDDAREWLWHPVAGDLFAV